MSDQTLFVTIIEEAFKGNVSSPNMAWAVSALDRQLRYNVKMYQMEEHALGLGATRSVVLPSSEVLADWRLIMARVIGSARIETTGKDTNGTTVINGYLPAYGTAILPGFIFLSTYNLTALLVRGMAAGTTVELFYGIAEEDA